MRFGEQRLSTDINMIVSDRVGYRELRGAISENGIGAISQIVDGAHRKCSPSLSESAHPVAVITVAVDGSR